MIILALAAPFVAGLAPAPPCDPGNGGITLPSGFCATVFADSLGGPRQVVVGSDGTVYVTLIGGGAAAQPVGVLALKDPGGTGHAASRLGFGTPGGTGIAIHAGYLYVDARTAIIRYKIGAEQASPPDTIVRGLPTGGHSARNIAFDAQGRLYVNVGSRTNSCQQADRQNTSPGVDPCVELETRAGIWRFDANKTGQTQATGEHVVTGIRNAEGLSFNPTDGHMYSTQHGRDQLFENWPAFYQAADGHEEPAEEFMRLADGADFGWPYCYYDTRYSKLVLAPEYGGDGGHKIGRCASKQEPVAAFPGHWAPMSSMFYTKGTFPKRYSEGVFIVFHGSWNRAPDPQAGFRVVFVPMVNGKADGKFETFADGFAGDKPIHDPSEAAHRPVGIAEGPDGSLYVTDDLHGRIWRIVWRG